MENYSEDYEKFLLASKVIIKNKKFFRINIKYIFYKAG